jgi:hypothetical protein
MGAATSGTQAWYIEKGIQMTSFYPTDVQYELLARYPGIRVSSLTRRRSALGINLDVWRTQRAEAKGR